MGMPLGTVQPRSQLAFTVVELLLAAVLGALLLAVGWAWLWTLAGAGHGQIGRLETQTSVAGASRIMARELRGTTSLLPASATGCTGTAITFAVWHPETATVVEVAYVWDASRSLLWRSSSGSYLVEGVVGFSLAYLDAQGQLISVPSGGRLDAASAQRVAAVCATVSVVAGDAVSDLTCSVCLRGRPAT